MSAKKIADLLPRRPSASTILRVLRKNRYAKYSKRKPTSALKPHHKVARLKFANKLVDSSKYWKSVVFTDEKNFNLDDPDEFRCYWHDTRVAPKLMSKRVNGGGSVMIWADASMYGKTDVVFLNGRQNSTKYTETLRGNLLPYLEKLRLKMGNIEPVFQHDNASIHASRFTKGFLNDNNVTIMEWPAKSPDFNIIENVCVCVDLKSTR
ncbi:hypothetical protein PC116_g23242 [Phytophthora cactorum]|nr:hypothetical protein PC116_g23242 [Phytophthora cactorum]